MNEIVMWVHYNKAFAEGKLSCVKTILQNIKGILFCKK